MKIIAKLNLRQVSGQALTVVTDDSTCTMCPFVECTTRAETNIKFSNQIVSTVQQANNVNCHFV